MRWPSAGRSTSVSRGDSCKDQASRSAYVGGRLFLAHWVRGGVLVVDLWLLRWPRPCMPKPTEFVLLPPHLLPLTPEREEAAVRLLTELLLDEVAKRRPGVSGSASNDVSGGVSGVVVPFPERPAKPRKAA